MGDADLLRFHKKIGMGPNGCHVWTGTLTSHGYGFFKMKRRYHLAHRLLVETLKGPIPEGMHVHHRCYNRRCVNIDHLAVVTPRENTLDSPVSPPALNARKTHCSEGHEYSVAADGRRFCHICKTQKQRERRAKKCRMS